MQLDKTIATTGDQAAFADSLKLKVFWLNEYEWWQARTLEEAISAACKQTGLPPNEVADEDAHEVSPEQLDRLRYHYDGRHDGPTRSFKEELELRDELSPTKGWCTARSGLSRSSRCQAAAEIERSFSASRATITMEPGSVLSHSHERWNRWPGLK